MGGKTTHPCTVPVGSLLGFTMAEFTYKITMSISMKYFKITAFIKYFMENRSCWYGTSFGHSAPVMRD